MTPYPTFSAYAQEALAYYIYALVDPRTKTVFYVGKGKGERVLQHALGALKETEDEELSKKNELIREIHDAGLKVDAFILRHGIQNEAHAYATEAAVLSILSLMDPNRDNDYFRITNVAGGHHDDIKGLVHIDVVQSIFDAPQAPEMTEPTLIFKISRLWTPQMTAAELFEATRGWWTLGPNREKAKYALAVSKGVIRGAYRIDSWRQQQPGDRGWSEESEKKPRWGFDGSPAAELNHLLNTSVAHLFKQGQASPFLYLNC